MSVQRWFVSSPILLGVCGVLVTAGFPESLPAIQAQEQQTTSTDKEFVPLFNGRDLSGWQVVNVAPNTFTVQGDTLISTGLPTGTIRTDRMYENFVLELEWRHMKPGGNAGLFVWGDAVTARGTPFSRGIEVQVLDGLETVNYTSHGDLFSIHGSRMTPDRPHPNGWERCLPLEKRAKSSPEWNHYRVTANDGTIVLEVNGKAVSGGTGCHPRKGYLCIESEGSECHFRNLKLRELPSTGATEEETVPANLGYRTLYTGIDLAGWKTSPEHLAHWQPRDWVLHYDGQCTAKDPHLWTTEEFGDFELICDWRFSGKTIRKVWEVVGPDGLTRKAADGTDVTEEVDEAGDSGIYLRGSDKSQVNMWCRPVGSGEVYGYRMDASQPAAVRAGVTPRVRADKPIGEWNRFHIRLVGDRLTVHLNSQLVLEEAQLPGIPARGPIALQHHGDEIEFASILIREISTP